MTRAIVLVGLPSAGKTTVGKALATRLSKPFIDVDGYIEERSGKTITEIFAQDGEEEFRRLEATAIEKLVADHTVLAPGGGAVLNSKVREVLKGQIVIWLKVSINQALKRIGKANTRPLLAGDPRNKLKKLAIEREKFYREVADFSVNTDGLNPDQIVDQILKAIAEGKYEHRQS